MTYPTSRCRPASPLTYPHSSLFGGSFLRVFYTRCSAFMFNAGTADNRAEGTDWVPKPCRRSTKMSSLSWAISDSSADRGFSDHISTDPGVLSDAITLIMFLSISFCCHITRAPHCPPDSAHPYQRRRLCAAPQFGVRFRAPQFRVSYRAHGTQL